MLEEYDSALWDDRIWQLSLKSDKPIEVYNESTRDADGEPPREIESLSDREKAWLRAT